MSLRKLIVIPIRLFSRSPVTLKVPDPKQKDLKLETAVKVPPETDTKKLIEYVCGTNLLEEGGENIKVKPDSEYPEWLWSITSPLPLEELDKNSKQYWNKINKIGRKEARYIRSLMRNTTVHK